MSLKELQRKGDSKRKLFTFKLKGKKPLFDRQSLIEEIVSLKDPPLSRSLAELIASEVEKEMGKLGLESLSRESLNNLILAQFRELGLIKKSDKNNQTLTPQNLGLIPEVLEMLLPQKNKPSLMEEISEEMSVLPPTKEPLALGEQGQKTIAEFGPDAASVFALLARQVAEVERNYEPKALIDVLENRFYNLMATGDFLPSQGLFKALKNGGSPMDEVLIPVPYSLENQLQAIKYATELNQKGLALRYYGDGLDGLKKNVKASLREKGLDHFFQLTQTLVRSGFIKPEELSFTVRVDDPSFPLWIHNLTPGAHFGLTLILTEPFMEAVRENGAYSLLSLNGEAPKTEKAFPLFTKIIDLIHSLPETELLFINDEKERALYLPFESWIEGSFNLSRFVKEGKLDQDLLQETIKLAIHFLDNALELGEYPLSFMKKTILNHRKMRLNFVGGEALSSGENSEEILGQLASLLAKAPQGASFELGEKRGGCLGKRQRHSAFDIAFDSSWASKVFNVRNGFARSVPLTLEALFKEMCLLQKGGAPLQDVAPFHLAGTSSRESTAQIIIWAFNLKISRIRLKTEK